MQFSYIQRIIFIFSIFTIFLISIHFVSAMSFDYINPDIKISSLYQICSIENSADLYCNVLVTFGVVNRTNNLSSFDINEQGDVLFNESSIKLCDYGNPLTNDYRTFNLNCSNYGMLDNKVKSNSNSIYHYADLDLNINLSQLNQNPISLTFNYVIPNFVIKDLAYDNLFFNLYNLPNNTFIARSIILPKDSAIQSLYNLKIIERTSYGEWIIQSTNLGESTATYRDIGKEKSDQTNRDILIIVISLAGSLAIGFLFADKKMTKRTGNFWIFAGASLLFTSFLLFINLNLQNSQIAYTSLVFLILFFISGFLAYNSMIKDHKRETNKRDLLEMWRFIKNMFACNKKSPKRKSKKK